MTHEEAPGAETPPRLAVAPPPPPPSGGYPSGVTPRDRAYWTTSADRLAEESRRRHEAIVGPYRGDLSERLCAEAAKHHGWVEQILNDRSETAHVHRMELYGTIHGLRIALCLVHGWDPTEDADKEGRADELVQAWRERNQGEGPDGG